MKINGQNPFSSGHRAQAGFTLLEAMFVSVLTVMVVAGAMSAHFLGLRESQLLESKAGANDTARRSIGQLLNDIRATKGYAIGTMSGTNFIAITNGILQGTGLQLFSAVISTNQTLNTNQAIIYYFDSSQSNNNNGQLWRLPSSTGVPVVTVSNLINTLYFTSEDYQGNTQSVRSFKGVIHATLQFSQFLYPLTAVGSNGLFNYYRIDCRATPHLPDGP